MRMNEDFQRILLKGLKESDLRIKISW